MKTLKDKLIKLDCCEVAVNWIGSKTLEQAWQKCPRGDWMLWFFKKVYPEKLQELTLAKGHCANTVRHLMKNKRSIKAIDAAIAFGEGKATREELNAAAAAAAAAATAYAADAAADAAAAYAAADAAAYAAADAADADAAYAAARKTNQLLTADICRKYLSMPII